MEEKKKERSIREVSLLVTSFNGFPSYEREIGENDSKITLVDNVYTEKELYNKIKNLYKEHIDFLQELIKKGKEYVIDPTEEGYDRYGVDQIILFYVSSVVKNVERDKTISSFDIEKETNKLIELILSGWLFENYDNVIGEIFYIEEEERDAILTISYDIYNVEELDEPLFGKNILIEKELLLDDMEYEYQEKRVKLINKTIERIENCYGKNSFENLINAILRVEYNDTKEMKNVVKCILNKNN